MASRKNNEPQSTGETSPEGTELATGTQIHTEVQPCDDPTGVNICNWPAEMKVTPTGPVNVNVPDGIKVTAPEPIKVTQAGPIDVNLRGANVADTEVQAFWQYIRERSSAVLFEDYRVYINRVLCAESDEITAVNSERSDAISLVQGVDAYQLLRTATEAFLITNCMPTDVLKYPDLEPSRGGGRTRKLAAELTSYLGNGLPYINLIVDALDEPSATPFCSNTYLDIKHPCFVELLWSYWMEEGGLVQAINSISLRFQNKRGPGGRDALANFELHPLRPLANLLWGYVQDDDHRLTIARRAYEYRHQYGLPLFGKAVPPMRPADERSNFLQAFHGLLHQASIFFERASNLTVRADGFPLLNALREVHLLLAEGAHNQFRDLTWTARVEMLIQQWLLSRREMHEFLGGRQAVPFVERWMAPIESLRRLMGWGGASITHFRDLAVDGEQILLAIRYGNWSDTNDEEEARGWVQFWKPEIQRYIHSYQAVTGVDLSAATQTRREINATLPSILLQQRAARQRG